MGRKALKIRPYQCPRKTFNPGIILRNLKGWHGDCYLDKSEFSWMLRGQFSGSRELCLGWSDKDDCAREGGQFEKPIWLPSATAKRKTSAASAVLRTFRLPTRPQPPWHRFCLCSSSAFSCTDTCNTFKGLRKKNTGINFAVCIT